MILNHQKKDSRGRIQMFWVKMLTSGSLEQVLDGAGALAASCSFFVRCSICNRSFLRRSISTSRFNSSICLRRSSNFSSSDSLVVVRLQFKRKLIQLLRNLCRNFIEIFLYLLLIDLFHIGVIHIQSMVLFFQILYANFDIFVDLEPCVIHLSQCIILFSQILKRYE